MTGAPPVSIAFSFYSIDYSCKPLYLTRRTISTGKEGHLLCCIWLYTNSTEPTSATIAIGWRWYTDGTDLPLSLPPDKWRHAWRFSYFHRMILWTSPIVSRNGLAVRLLLQDPSDYFEVYIGKLVDVAYHLDIIQKTSLDSATHLECNFQDIGMYPGR